MKIKHTNVCAAVVALMAASGTTLAGELTANAAASSNYIWRGLTQTMNEAAVSGGIDFAADNGLYIGTWASNVEYAPGDAFSYEHDVYFGYSGGEDFTYDIGYLYYNYDDLAETDFSEVYGSVGYGGFSLKLSLLASAEADEPPGLDFGFAEASYISLDYAVPLRNDLALGLHVGRHDGDFAEWFNVVPEAYTDYSVSIAKGGFTFMISDTDLEADVPDGLDNGAIKFVVGYSMDFEL